MVAHGLLVRPGCSTYRRDGDDVGSTAFVGGPGSRARPVPGLADLRGAPLVIGGAAASCFFLILFVSAPHRQEEGGGALSWPPSLFPPVSARMCAFSLASWGHRPLSLLT